MFGSALSQRTVLRASLSATLGAAAFAVSFAFAGHAGAQIADHAKYLHEVCRAATGAPNTVVVTDSDRECIFRTVAGTGTSTFYNYFSGASENNFCVRTVVTVPNAPTYDRTTCGDVSGTNAAQGITQGKILEEIEGADDAIRIAGEKVEYVEGTVRLLRKGGTMPATADLAVQPGDLVKVPEHGVVEILSSGNALWLGGDTEMGVTGLKFDDPQSVISPDEPLDPQNFRLERDDMAFWKGLFTDIVDFNLSNPPKFLKSCLSPEVVAVQPCSKDTATFLYKGFLWFDHKMEEDYGSGMVVTPTAAITPNGTVFLVEVAGDGATTVRTFEGSVIVTDLKSRKSVAVGANQKVTVPKTAKGLSVAQLREGLSADYVKPGEAWWLDAINRKAVQAAKEGVKAGERANQAAWQEMVSKNRYFFAGLVVALILMIAAISRVRSKYPVKK